MKKVLKIFGFAVLGITAVIALAIGGFALFGGFKQEKIEITSLYFEDEIGVKSDTLYLYGVIDEELINIKYEPKDATETKLKFTPVGSANAPMLDMAKLQSARANEGFAISPTKKLDGKNVGGSVKLKVSSANNDNCFCYIYVVVDVEVDDNTIDFKAPNLITQIDTEVGYAKSYLAKKASNQNISLNAPDSNGLNIDTAAIAKGIKKDVYLDYDPSKITITKTNDSNKVVASVVSGSIINKVVSKDAVENSIDYLDIFYDRLNNKYNFTINPTDKTGNTKITMRMHRTYKIQEEYNANFVIKEEVVDGNYRYIKYTSIFEQYKDLTSAEIDNMERTNPIEFAKYMDHVNKYNEFLNKYLKYFTQSENAKNFFYSYITDGELTLDYKKPEEQILKSINFVFVEETIYLYITDVEVGSLKVGNNGKSNIFYVSEDVKYTLSELISDGIYNDEGSLKYQPFHISIEADNTGETNPTIILENNLAVQSMLSNITVDVYAYTIKTEQIRADNKTNIDGLIENQNKETNFSRFNENSDYENIWWRRDISPEELIASNTTFLKVVKNEDNTFSFIPKVPTEYLQNLKSDINLYLKFTLKVESAEYGTGYFYDYSYVKVSYKNVSNFTMGSLSNMTINEGESLKYQGEQRTQLLTSTTIKKEDSPYNQVYYFVESSSNIKDSKNLIYHVNVLKDKNGKAIEFGFLNLDTSEIQSVLENKRLTGHLICIPDDEDEAQYIFNKIMALNITGTFNGSDMIENPIKVFAVVLLTDRDGNPITNMGESIDLLSQEEVKTDSDNPLGLRNVYVINYPKSINDIKQIKTEYILDRLYYYTKSENDQPYYYEEFASGVGTVLKTVEQNEYFLRNNRPLEVESKYTTLKLLAEDKYDDLITVSPLLLESNGDITTTTEIDELGNNIDVLYNVLYTFTKAFNNEEFLFVFEGSSTDKTFAEVYNRKVTVKKSVASISDSLEDDETEVEITDYFNFELLLDSEGKETNLKKNFKINVRTLGEESGINTINLKEINYSFNNCSGVMDGAVATVINFIEVSDIKTIYHNDRVLENVDSDGDGVYKDIVLDQISLENLFKFETEKNSPSIIPGITTWQIVSDTNTNEFFFNYYVTDAHYNVAEYLYRYYKDGTNKNPDKEKLAKDLMNRTVYTSFKGDNFKTVYNDFATLLDCWVDDGAGNKVNTLIDSDGVLGTDYGSSWNNLYEAIKKIDSTYVEEYTSLVYDLLKSNKDALAFDVSVDLFTHKKSDTSIIITDINDIYELIFSNMILNNGDKLEYKNYKNKVDKENKITLYSDLFKEDGKTIKDEYKYLTSEGSIINLYLGTGEIRSLINNLYPDRELITSVVKNDYESLYAVISALKIIIENTEINKSGMTVEDIDELYKLNEIKNTYDTTTDNEATTDINEKEKVIADQYQDIKENVIRVLLYASIGTPYVTYHNGYAEYYSGLKIENNVNTSDNITNEGQYQRLKNIVRTLNLMLAKNSEINENLVSVRSVLMNVNLLKFNTDKKSEYVTESGKTLILSENLQFYTTLNDLITDKLYESNALSLEEYKAQIAKEHSDNPNYVTQNEDKIIRDYVTMLIATKVDSSFSQKIIEDAIKNVTSNANSDSLVDIKYVQKNEELRKYFELIDANGEIIVENDGYISFIPSIDGNEITKDDYVMIGGSFDYLLDSTSCREGVHESTIDENSNLKFVSYSLQTAEFTLAEVGSVGFYTRNVTYIHKKQIESLSLNNIYNLVYYEISDDMFSPEGDKDRILGNELYEYYNDNKYLKPVHIWRHDVGYYEFVSEYDTNNIGTNLSNYIDVSDIFAINNTNGEYYQIVYYIYVGETVRIENLEDPTQSIKVYNLNAETAEYEVNALGKYYYNMVDSFGNPAYRAFVQHIELPVTIVASFYPYFENGIQKFRSVHEKEFVFKLKFEIREPVISSYIYSDNAYSVDGANTSYEYFGYEYYVDEIDFVSSMTDINKYGVVEFRGAENNTSLQYVYDDKDLKFKQHDDSLSGNLYNLYLNGLLVVEHNTTLINEVNNLNIQPNQKLMIKLNDINIAVIESRYNLVKSSASYGLFNIDNKTISTASIKIVENGVDLNGDGVIQEFDGFYYELCYNNENIVGNASAETIWKKYLSIITSNIESGKTTFKVVVNSHDGANNYNDSQSYHKVKYTINSDNNGLFDKDPNSKNFKFNNKAISEKPSGKYDMHIETTSGYKKLVFEKLIGYYKINGENYIQFDETGLSDYTIKLGDKVINKDLTNSATSKVTYTTYGNFTSVDAKNYLDAEFARQKLQNSTTNQYVVYGNTQIELAELIDFEQKVGSGQLIPHIKFKVSNVQGGTDIAYFIDVNKDNKEQSEQVGYNNYIVYNRETGKFQTSTSVSSDKVTLYFRETNSIKYIYVDMYLMIGSQEIKFYTYYITVNPSITLSGISNNYIEVNSGQDNIELDVAIKQVVNEVGTMVNYGEYGYAISTYDYNSKNYISVAQLNSEDEERNTGYKVFSQMSIGEIYNRTNETFKIIICYKDSNGNWIIPKDSLYSVTVRVRPTYMVVENTSPSNPFETIYYENKGISDVKEFDLNNDELKRALFSINRNTLNDYSIYKNEPQLTYSIAEDQNDAVKDILGNIKLENGKITFENPISFDFTLKIKATYGVGGVYEEDYAYIKFQGLNFYFDTPNQAFGENNTDKLGMGSLPLDSENGYKLSDTVDNSFLNNQKNYNVTLMANNTYDLRTIINLVYYDKNNTNPIYVGFLKAPNKNATEPVGTTLFADAASQYAGISYKLSIPRIYDLSTNQIVIDIYAYAVIGATSRIAYDTGRDLIINVVPDFEISLNNDVATKPTQNIATINGTNLYGLEVLNGKSILDIDNLLNVTSLINGNSLYNEENFDKNEFLRKAVTVGYDIDNMTRADDKYYIVQDSITFKSIDLDRAIDVVKLINGIAQTAYDSEAPLTFENGVVKITKFAYEEFSEGYYNLLIPIVIKNNSLPAESQLLNSDQLYIKVANTSMEIDIDGSDLRLDNDSLVYEQSVMKEVDLLNYIEFNFTENGFEGYKDTYKDYILNIRLADDYNTTFYKNFVEIKSRKIDTNDDRVGDYEVFDLINIYPAINNSISLILEIEYIFVKKIEKTDGGASYYIYEILDTLNNGDKINLQIKANYEVSVDESKYLPPITQSEVKDDSNGEVTTKGINLTNVYSINNYQNIFESDLFKVYSLENDPKEEIGDPATKVQIASQGIKSYVFSNTDQYYKFDTANNKWIPVYKYELGTMRVENGRLEITDLGYDVLVPIKFSVYGGFGDTKTYNFEDVVIYFLISSNVIEISVDNNADPSDIGLNEINKVNGVEYLAGRGVLDGEKEYDLSKNISVKAINNEEVEPLAEETEPVYKDQYYFDFKIVKINDKSVTGNVYKSPLNNELDYLIKLEVGQSVGESNHYYNKLIVKSLTKEYKIELSYNYFIVTYDNEGNVVSIKEIPCNKSLIVYAMPNLRIYNSPNEILLGTDHDGEVSGYAILNNQSLFTTPNETNITDSNNNILVNGTIIYANAYSQSQGNFGFDYNGQDIYGISNDKNYINLLKSKVQLKYSATEPYRKWDNSNNAYVNYSNTTTAQGDIFHTSTLLELQNGIISIDQLDYDVILPIEFFVEGELIDIIYVKVFGCFVADENGSKVSQITVNSGETIDLSNYHYSSIGSVLLNSGKDNYEVLYNYRSHDLSTENTSYDYNANLKNNIYNYYSFIKNEFDKLDSFTDKNGFINDVEYFDGFDSADGVIDDEEFKQGFMNNKFALTGINDSQFDNDYILNYQLRERVYNSLKDRSNFDLYDTNLLLRLQRYFTLVYGVVISNESQSAMWTDFITLIYNENNFDGFVEKYKNTTPVLEGKTANLEQELLMFAYRNLIIREVGEVYQYNNLNSKYLTWLNGSSVMTSKIYSGSNEDGVEENPLGDITDIINLYGNVVKSKKYLEGTKFEKDSDETNDDVDKFSSAWLEKYLDETLNNDKDNILSAYNSNEFNWDTFVATYSGNINDLEAKMFEFAIKNFIISVCDNEKSLGNLYYYHILDTSESHDDFNEMVQQFYSTGLSSGQTLSLITSLKYNNTTSAPVTDNVIVDAYVVEKITDSKTGVDYYKLIGVYYNILSINVVINN